MKPIYRPETGEQLTSSIAELDDVALHQVLFELFPRVADIEEVIPRLEYVFMPYDELVSRIEQMEDFIITRGHALNSEWLTNLVLDNCVVNGVLSIDMLFAYVDAMWIHRMCRDLVAEIEANEAKAAEDADDKEDHESPDDEGEPKG